jgi:hypothetical protein
LPATGAVGKLSDRLPTHTLKTKTFDQRLCLAAYGVAVEITTNSKRATREFRRVLARDIPGCAFLTTGPPACHRFRYVWNASGRDTLYKNGETVAKRGKREDMLGALVSRVRIAIAEFAADRVFIHAGVVGWKGRAIILPAKSFHGKSTLTAELVRLGALYYSDEYAVLDRKGRVHPFAKPLSLRGIKDSYTQVHRRAEAIGGKVGKRSLPVGIVLFTQYKKNAKWRPRKLSQGSGMIELIKNTVPVRYNPKFVLEVLGRAAEHAIFIRTTRGEAPETAQRILDLLEEISLSTTRRSYPYPG